MLERRRVVRIGEESEVEDATGTSQDSVWKRGLVRECAQLLEKCCETGRESRNFEDGGSGRSFEEERNRLA